MENTSDRAQSAASARALIRRAWKGALGTIDRETGHPLVSLVTVATEADGTPLLLLSRLALHTQNLLEDPRASLLIDGTGAGGAALAGDRVSLTGQVVPTRNERARNRFLARHPSAQPYAGFADFSFYRLELGRGHFVGGFGRIVALETAELLVATTEVEALLAAEPELVAELNAGRAGLIAQIAAGAGSASGDGWRLTAIDPEGLDLAAGDTALRIRFPHPVRTPDEARRAIMDLANPAAIS
jgi:putative heme iron utilization protein